MSDVSIMYILLDFFLHFISPYFALLQWMSDMMIGLYMFTVAFLNCVIAFLISPILYHLQVGNG